MLQWINDRMKVFGWLIILPLALVFAVWGVHGIVDFTTRQDKGLKVNGEDLNLERVRQAYQQQLAQLNRIYPDEVPASVRTSVQQRIVKQFVNSKLVEQKTAELHYVVTDRDVIDSIQAYQGFQVNGQFNKDSYYALLRAQGYTPEGFEAEQRQLLKARALEGGMYLSSFATATEVARAAALRGETREVGYAVLPLSKFLPGAKADEAAIKAYYDAHKDAYMTPESVRLTYIQLRVADAAKDVPVDEATLRGYFDTVKDRYVEPEKRRARHVLIQSGTDDAAARKKADEVYQEAIKPGADFAALAKKYSQDAGSAGQGGDLGWAEKTFFVGPFAEVVFAMKPGEIKGPVKTQFGWHVIKLEEIAPGKSKNFEDVKAELEPEYRKSEAERRFGERQEKIEQLAFEQSGSLEPVAKALGLKIEEIAVFYKGLAGNELAASPKVVQAAFSADLLGGQNSKAIELSPGNVVVVRASDHKLPQQQSLADVRAEVETAVHREVATAAALAAADKVAGALLTGAAWDAALRPVGPVAGPAPGKSAAADAIRFEAPKFIGRSEAGLAHELLEAAFKAATPAPGAHTTGTVSLANGDVAVYAVTAVKPGEVKAGGGAELRQLAETEATTEFDTYLSALRARADVRYSPTIFE
ncbi:MAG TPA: SurA N-terminal domain-containing protein [Steroidobacteraceae bacterium]|nr:SurA N-terminal domain-containing protein [Steroidobacteraceae bacterium]